IWLETKEQRSTQLIFSDSGTPKPGKFNVYDEIKRQLIEKNIPENEIAFIHDAKTEAQRDALFEKVREGEVRILVGSTGKVGTGTNIQDKLIAAHHVDCPWRPSDIEQRDGRIVRQGNENKEIQIYRY
ncbi:helicase C-terminal domain-containing protein, partial [Vibrio sp. FNV 38]|nr:helicase C-terminal domain-containing protein [Vibrio sp. FNV 38]